MPILAAEQAVYPPNLLEGFAKVEDDRHWWAVYTKSRQEKSLARQLLSMEIPFFLPLIAKTNVIRGRRLISQIPLFSNYVFLFGTDDERLRALSTERIVQILPTSQTQEMTTDLQNIHTMIQTGVPMTLESRLDVGRRVRVKSGALMGTEGTVISRRGENRLLVAVHFLQQGVSVLIDDFQVEPV